MENTLIYLDEDSFFLLDIDGKILNENNDTKHYEYTSIDDENQTADDLFEQLYFGFKSSINLVLGENNKFEKKHLESLHELCVSVADACLLRHKMGVLKLPIPLISNIRTFIEHQYISKHPEVTDIRLLLTLKPRITARADRNNTIYLPALARGMLIHFNLMLLNIAFSSIDDGLDIETIKGNRLIKKLPDQINKQMITRAFLPYLAFCHDNISVSNLPFVSAHSSAAYKQMRLYTNIQMLFICAHEYSHIILHHFENTNLKTQLELECEADEMALEMVVEYIRDDQVLSLDDIFTAIRWLFKYQMLEEYSGNFLQGLVVDYKKSSFEYRRKMFQITMQTKYNVTTVKAFDQIGFLQILQLQEVLIEYGIPLYNSMLNAFEKSKGKKEIDAWWEMIKEN